MLSRIALIGNCQGGPLQKVLTFLAPFAEVSFFSAEGLNQRFGEIGGLVQALRNFDFVFCQEFGPDAIRGGSSAVLADRLAELIQFPSIVFPAFHPDIVYVHLRVPDSAPVLLESPLGHYHSSLILYGFLQRLTPLQTEGLFSEPILRRVGFLDAWGAAQEGLLEAGRRVSMPLEREFIAWSRQGCFMHSINHPRLFTLVDISRMLLRRADLPIRDEDPSTFIVDYLMANIIWPVYPPIARALGCSGALTFKSNGVNTYFDLGELIEASFKIYAGCAPGTIVCPRTEAWLRDQKLSAYLRAQVTA